MSVNLLIITNSAQIDAAGRNAITTYLEGRGWDVWHWFEDVWLVGGVPETVKVTKINSDITKKLNVMAGILVIMVHRDSPIAGQAAEAAVPWLFKHFPRSGPPPEQEQQKLEFPAVDSNESASQG